MKKLFLLLLIFPVFFVACSSDDDEDEAIDYRLVGTWTFKPTIAKATVVNDLDGKKLQNYIEENMVDNFSVSKMTLQNSGNASVEFEDGTVQQADWAAMDNEFAIRFVNSAGEYTTFTYTLNSTSLILKLDQTVVMKKALLNGDLDSILDKSKNENFDNTTISKVEVILEASK